jgi:hypothetical protein
MGSFDSPNFKSNIPQSQQNPLQQFTVGPPDEDLPAQSQAASTRTTSFGPPQQIRDLSPSEEEAMMREARRQKLENINSPKIGDLAKKRIELLADIGRLTKDVKIGNYTFSLRTLKAKETRQAALSTFSTAITQLEASYEARKQQLARSIFKIDGEDLDMIIGNTSLEARMSFIEDNLEDIVVEKLWDEFIALKEESRVKYGINTVKDVEEVSADLKK